MNWATPSAHFPIRGLDSMNLLVYSMQVCGNRQVGDEIDAKLSPGFKRYRFQLISTLFKFGTSLHLLASFTAVNKLLHFVCYALQQTLDVSRETVLSLPKWPLIALASTVVLTPSWDIRTNLHYSSSFIMTGTYLTDKNCTTTMKFLGVHSTQINI